MEIFGGLTRILGGLSGTPGVVVAKFTIFLIVLAGWSLAWSAAFDEKVFPGYANKNPGAFWTGAAVGFGPLVIYGTAKLLIFDGPKVPGR